jgi:hypothetical protein
MKKLAYLFCILPQLAIAQAITWVDLESSEEQYNVPVTFGQPFVVGDVPPAASIVTVSGTSIIPSQMDVKARHADGSVRHAIITLMVPHLKRGVTRVDIIKRY